jgi:integral membrane sensor domain MASE1
MVAPPRLRAWAVTGAWIVAIAAAYYLAAKVGLLQALVRDQVTPLWPPTGIALAALFFGGLRVWPGITVAACLVNASVGPSTLAVLSISAGNTLAPVCAYLLLRRVGFHLELDRVRDALALVFLGAFGGMAISATIGTTTLVTAGAVPPDNFWSVWSVWWTGDAMGVLAIVPVVLAVRTRRSWRAHPYRWVEGVGLLVGTAGVALFVTTFSGSLLFLTFPFLIWAALRFQHIGAAPCALIVVTLAVRAAAMDLGPFAGLGLLQRMATLQAFNSSVTLTALLLAAVVSERNAARLAIERTCAHLADVVNQYQPMLLKRILEPPD